MRKRLLVRCLHLGTLHTGGNIHMRARRPPASALCTITPHRCTITGALVEQMSFGIVSTTSALVSELGRHRQLDT